MTAGLAQLDAVWRTRGAEVWSASLVPFQAKGTWRGAAVFATAVTEIDETKHEHVAWLTYGKVRVRRMVGSYLRGFPKTAKRAIQPDSPMTLQPPDSAAEVMAHLQPESSSDEQE